MTATTAPALDPSIARRLRRALVAEGVDLGEPWPTRDPKAARPVDDPIRAIRRRDLLEARERVALVLEAERAALEV